MNLFREAFHSSSLFFQIIWSLLLVVLVFLVVMALGILSGLVFFNLSYAGFSQVLSDGTHPLYMGIMKYLQGVQALGLFVFPPLLLAWLFTGRPLVFLKLRVAPGLQNLVWTLLAVLFLLAPVNFLASYNESLTLPESLQGMEQWMREMEDRTREVLEGFLQVTSVGDLLVNIFIVAVLAGVGEELFFRGILQPLMIRMTRNVFWGVVLSAFIFSMVHFQFFGFIPRFVMGMFLGYLLVWTGSMWVPVFAHFVNNLLGVLLAYGIFNGLLPPDTEIIFSDSRFWPLWVGGTVLGIICLKRLRHSGVAA